MAFGFYYHTNDFDEEQLTKKALSKIDEYDSDFNEVKKDKHKPLTAKQTFESQFAESWVAPQYGSNGIFEFDVKYNNLNEKSKRKEIDRLEDETNQFIVLEVSVEYDEKSQTLSFLIEVRGSASGDKTEYYITEYIDNNVEVCKDEQN